MAVNQVIDRVYTDQVSTQTTDSDSTSDSLTQHQGTAASDHIAGVYQGDGGVDFIVATPTTTTTASSENETTSGKISIWIWIGSGAAVLGSIIFVIIRRKRKKK